MSTIDNRQETIALNMSIDLVGRYPSDRSVESQDNLTLAMLRTYAFDFFEVGADVSGQLFPIAEYSALFSLLGTTFGGDGRSTFGLPDLEGAIGVGAGTGPGLASLRAGQKLGANDLALEQAQFPVTLGGSSSPANNHQNSIAFNYLINTSDDGDTPPGASEHGFLGQIVPFVAPSGFTVPGGWAVADGHLLSIADNAELFNVIGTIYGGDGRTTFALPDLRGRTPVGASNDAGDLSLGQKGGTSQFTLTPAQFDASLDGSGDTFANTQPSLGVNYAIAINGVFPSRGRPAGDPVDAATGEVVTFAGTTPPEGFVLAHGQTLPINQYQALFSLIGPQYGGDGRTTFKLPDLRGRAVTDSGADHRIGVVEGSNLQTVPEGIEDAVLSIIKPEIVQLTDSGGDEDTDIPVSVSISKGDFVVGLGTFKVTLVAENGVLKLKEQAPGDTPYPLDHVIVTGLGTSTVTLETSVFGADGRPLLNALTQELLFRPDANFNNTQGEAKVTVTADDGGFRGNGLGASTTTSVIDIPVAPVNDAPVANDDVIVGQAVSSEFLVNEETAGAQSEASISTLANGNLIVTWQSAGGSGSDVRARIIDKFGAGIVSDFLVNEETSNTQYLSDVTPLSNGGFVVTWQSFDGIDDASRSGIKARIFNASGEEVVSEFLVNEEVSGVQSTPVVTAFSNGDFVIAWTSDEGGGILAPSNVKARIFNENGVEVVSEFFINQEIINSQGGPAVTTLSGGGFVAAWVSNDGIDDSSGSGIKVRIFDESGLQIVSEFLVNTQIINSQNAPSITGLSNGGFIAAWMSRDGIDDTSGSGIKARIFDALGVEIVSEFLVNDEINAEQRFPTITALLNGGFVVAWDSNDDMNGDALLNFGVKARIFDALGAEVVSEFIVSERTTNEQVAPSVTALSNGGFAVVWGSTDGVDDTSISGIKAQYFDALGNRLAGEDANEDTIRTIQPIELLANDTDVEGDELSITEVSATSANGATVTLNDDGSIDYDPTAAADIQALGEGDTLNDTFTYTVSDGNGGTDIATASIEVNGVNDAPVANDDVIVGQAVSSEFLVNEETDSAPLYPSIDTLTNGNIVFVFRGGSASDYGLKGLILDEFGNEVTSEFLINMATTSLHFSTTVTALAGGGFIVVWQSDGHADDTSGSGITASIFNASGAEVVSEFLVNDETTNSQRSPAVTALSNGGFIITWDRPDSIGGDMYGQTDIKARIFDASGIEVVSEFFVNEEMTNFQRHPTVTELSTGGFVVAWISNDGIEDTSSQGIKARIFDASGVEVVSEFLVNEQTNNSQSSPDITALSDGNFIVVWHSNDGSDDTSYADIKARIFNSTGVEIISEFQVNQETNRAQFSPTTTVLSNGNFVVAWQSNDGSDESVMLTMGYDVKVRIFSESGDEIVSEFLLNQELDGSQVSASIAALSNGGFVVTWYSDNEDYDASGYGLKAQYFDALGNRVVGNNITEDETRTIQPIELLANDTDAEDDELSITEVSATSANGATVTLNDDGTIDYDPTAAADIQALGEGDTLNDTFTYTVSDGNGGTDIATASIEVNGLDDAPTAMDDDLGQGPISEDETFIFNIADLIVNDFDADGDDISITAVDLVSDRGATITMGPDGQITYDPTQTPFIQIAWDDLVIEDSFQYELTDSAGLKSYGTASISVAGDGVLHLGDENNNQLTGGSREDAIFGLAGRDILKGKDGNDFFSGGAGYDRIFGNQWGDEGSASDIDTVFYDGAFSDYKFSAYSYAHPTLGKTVVRLIITDSADGGADGLNEGTDVLRDIDQLVFQGEIYDVADILEDLNPELDIRGDSGDNFIVGDAANNVMKGYYGNDTFIGNAGDDKFFGAIWGNRGPASDIDTVIYAGNFTDYNIRGKLYDHPYIGDVQRLIITDSADGGFDGVDEGKDVLQDIDVLQFNDRSMDVLLGTGADEILETTSEDELFVGFGGNDTFYFFGNAGQDVILDFEAGEGTDDVVFFEGVFSDFVEILAAASDDGKDTTIVLNGPENTLVLEGVIVADLHEDDFNAPLLF